MGRNQGRGRGRGGRYQGRGKSNNKKEDKQKQKKEVSQMLFQVGTAKQASEYTNIKKYCVNYFRKNYTQGHYIAQAIEEGEDFDFDPEKPTTLVIQPEVGSDDDIAIIRSLNEAEKINYKLKLD